MLCALNSRSYNIHLIYLCSRLRVSSCANDRIGRRHTQVSIFSCASNKSMWINFQSIPRPMIVIHAIFITIGSSWWQFYIVTRAFPRHLFTLYGIIFACESTFLSLDLIKEYFLISCMLYTVFVFLYSPFVCRFEFIYYDFFRFCCVFFFCVFTSPMKLEAHCARCMF